MQHSTVNMRFNRKRWEANGVNCNVGWEVNHIYNTVAIAITIKLSFQIEEVANFYSPLPTVKSCMFDDSMNFYEVRVQRKLRRKQLFPNNYTACIASH